MQILIKYPLQPNHVYYALKALKPDPRAPFTISLNDNELTIEIDAKDSVAARRILNSILRITGTIEKVEASFLSD